MFYGWGEFSCIDELLPQENSENAKKSNQIGGKTKKGIFNR